MKTLLFAFLLPLLITEVIEIATGCIIGIRGKRDVTLIFLVNIITNLSLNLLLVSLRAKGVIQGGYLLTYGVLEPLVIAIEWFFYRAFMESEGNKLKISIILNLCSIIGGLIWAGVYLSLH